MELPMAVQRQVEEADKLQEELIGKAEPEKETLPEEEPEVTPEEVKKVPVEETVPSKEDTVEYWKHKYNTLHGMYKAEVRKESDGLRQEIDKQNKVIASLNDIVVTFQTEREKSPKKEDEVKKEEVKPVSSTLKEEDFQDYGDEMLAMVKTVNNLIDENEKLKVQLGTVGQTVQKTTQTVQGESERRFFSELSGMASNWQSLNNDVGFNEWLDLQAEPSELEAGDTFGNTRRKLLEGAFYGQNAKRVAKFFNDYKPSSKSSKGTPIDPGSLEDQALPEGSGAGEPIKKGSTVTPEQLAKASLDYTQGRITEEQYDKIANAYQRGLKAGAK
uniref:Uncharacterized protein n=1 Tax=viral metagenome TaxID=1070528 RepID=A0A6M3XS52_9ZZZZ